MALLQKIKEKLGLGGGSPEDGSGETEVTVERESDRDVGGTDEERAGRAERTEETAASGTDAAASTDSLVDEKDAPEGAAEPGEATGPESDDVTVDMDEAAAAEESDVDFGDEAAEETVDESAEESAASGTEASASTGSITEEPSAVETATEPAEAAGPETDDIAIDADEDEAGDDEGVIGDDVEGVTGDDEGVIGDDDATADGDPVDSIRGIGPAYAERLAAIDVETVSDLAAADVEEVAEGTSVGEKRAGEWIDRAKSR